MSARALCRAGMFVCASDALEYLGSLNGVTITHDGVTVLAHPSPLTVGRNHGVYALEQQQHHSSNNSAFFASVSRVLQKPDEATMRIVGAVHTDADGDEFVYTDSAYYMTMSVVR